MVTSLDYIKKIANGIEVEISGWEEEVSFVCKLKRVSLIGLVGKGKVPNPLIGAVMALFDGDKNKIDKISAKEMSDIIELFCKETLVEPSYSDVSDFLTDEQRTEIFNFAQGGLNQLKNFRNKRTDTISNKPSN